MWLVAAIGTALASFPVWAWIAAGVLAWSVTAVLLGLLIGRVIRRRDRQRPDDDDDGQAWDWFVAAYDREEHQ